MWRWISILPRRSGTATCLSTEENIMLLDYWSIKLVLIQVYLDLRQPSHWLHSSGASAAAAKSLQSYLTLCDPIDGSPGILQAITLEWFAISFSNAWKWSHFSCVRLLAAPQTAANQAPPSMGFSRQEYWSGVPLPSLHQGRGTIKYLISPSKAKVKLLFKRARPETWGSEDGVWVKQLTFLSFPGLFSTC